MFGFLLRILPPEQKRRPGVDLGAPDTRWSLMQLRRFGFIPKHVMDVGAFKGDWTRTCLKMFPSSLHEVVNYLYKRGVVMFDVDELIRSFRIELSDRLILYSVEWTFYCVVRESWKPKSSNI